MLYGTESLDLLARNSKIDAQTRASVHKKDRAPRSNKYKKNGLNPVFKPLYLWGPRANAVCLGKRRSDGVSEPTILTKIVANYQSPRRRCGRGSRNLPLCGARNFIAMHGGIAEFSTAAAANLLPSSATGSGRSRDPRLALRVVECTVPAARIAKKGHPCGCPFLVAGAVGIEPTTRGFGDRCSTS